MNELILIDLSDDDQVIADWLLARGLSPQRVAKMMGVEIVEAALNELRPLCEECDAPGTRHFSTEGDGNYWLCDSVAENHGIGRYQGEPIPQDALREFLGTREPELCGCVTEAQARSSCRECGGSGWVIPQEASR